MKTQVKNIREMATEVAGSDSLQQEFAKDPVKAIQPFDSGEISMIR